MIQEAIQRLVERTNLSSVEAQSAMEEVMAGQASQAQIASFLVALRMKGETIDEVTSFAKAMKQFSCNIHPKTNGGLLDTCGTGGDRLKTFNVSTIAAFIAAGAGMYVAKHGNRSVTSMCGSADLLEKLGLNLNASPQVVEKAIEEVGIGFMFAPIFHPAMKNAIGPRREIGIRSVFNILGPLTNPAGADTQLLGVYDPSLTTVTASVLKNLGVEKAMVVHGLDGMDEISITNKTVIAELHGGEIHQRTVSPKDFGVSRASVPEIIGSSPEENLSTAYRILVGSNPNNPKSSMALMNAAACIFVGGFAKDLGEGMERARQSLVSGMAYKKLKMLVNFTGGNLEVLEGLEAKYD